MARRWVQYCLWQRAADHCWCENTWSGVHKCRGWVHPVIFHWLKWGRESLILAHWQHLSPENNWFVQHYWRASTVVRPSAIGSIWSIVSQLVIVMNGWFSCLLFHCWVHRLEPWSEMKLQQIFSMSFIYLWLRLQGIVCTTATMVTLIN